MIMTKIKTMIEITLALILMMLMMMSTVVYIMFKNKEEC